jgi:ATP-dependent Clp protease ATP-binding subunit ClpC
MYDRFTDQALHVMQLADQEADWHRHDHLGTEHLLLGLLKREETVAFFLLKQLRLDLNAVYMEVKRAAQQVPAGGGKRRDLTPRARQAVERAIAEADRLRRADVGTEHLLLGLLGDPEGMAAQVLRQFGIDTEDVRRKVHALGGVGGA